MLPYFVFKDIDSRNYLTVNKSPSIFNPEKDITIIEIDGRDGFLTQDNGTYKSFIKEVECTITDLTNIDYICSWLTGSGDVVFSNQSDRSFKATIVNQIEFARVFKEYRTFIIQFKCQPFSCSLINDLIILEVPGEIFNPGVFKSLPVMKIYGTGNIDLTINNNLIHLTNVVDYVVIDSVIMDSYKGSVLKNNYMAGKFPELIPGINNISYTGTVTKIEITPNFISTQGGFNMAATQMGITTGGRVTQWIGTHAERLVFELTFNGGAGSTFWEKDTKTGWIWDGSAFNAV